MKSISIGVVAASILVGAAFAAAPDQSVRPVPRPSSGQDAVPVAGDNLRPKPRPATAPTKVPTPFETMALAAIDTAPTALAVSRSLHPKIRTKRIARKAEEAAREPAPARAGRKGAICGVNSIKGQVLSPIAGRIAGCGVANPVRVTSVSGVQLSQSATMDCTTAKALNTWVRKGVFPSIGRLGGGPKSLKVVAHYACRTRNNQPGAKISEHGRGRAVDIAGVTLKNGAHMSVLKGWRDPVQGKALKSMHKAACGPFGTVLGPNANKYHQDHFHFDTARYRSGSYCR